MARIEYEATDGQGLDLIDALWCKLKEHHKILSLHFAEYLARITFDQRKKELLDKSREGALRIDLVRDVDTAEIVGYCVSTISGNKQGEIESIYVESDYRQFGIGDNLMKRALRWMDEQSVTRKTIAVSAGNEEVFTFYSQHSFYPRVTILEQTETGKSGDTDK